MGRGIRYAARFVEIAQMFPLLLVLTGATDYIPKLESGQVNDTPARLKFRGRMEAYSSVPSTVDVRAHHIIAYDFADHEVVQYLKMDLNHPSNGAFIGIEQHKGGHDEYRKAMRTELNRIATLDKSCWEAEVVRIRNNAAIALRSGAPLLSKHGSSISGWNKIFRGKRI